MAMQTGVGTSKVLILIGAGLTGSVVLKSGQLTDLILQLQELTKGVNDAGTSSGRYDTAVLAAQIRCLAQEIRELTISRPITILNENSGISGNLASYIVPATALGAMGYCYMWWKGLSLSDVMFVTKQNMVNAVANVSQQLEQVSALLSSTKRHLSQRLENLDGKLEEQRETTKLVMNEVIGVKSDLSQIGYDVEIIQKMVSGLEGKIELIEGKQDVTNAGLWYLCHFAEGIKDGISDKLFQDTSAKLPPDRSTMVLEGTTLRGLQFIADTTKSGDAEILEEKVIVQNDNNGISMKNNIITKTRIHRSYPVGISLTRDDR
ncbi:golgin family A protein [Thalictrum thalictroides]|uniref:Golgin family A protein n=1 Tax=Thalictrum thalictroides TaxID=46969 RepID=A0A7J6WGF5_THATH|nr:golgin family A protein [Thalictrum thalictroides]